ncbi:hypothetical protein Q1695_014144 [Nippostrongylus brasiliensis]|nr:hypothetical protein Q1695_014144 [Nippostrongylus brasiliensis]
MIRAVVFAQLWSLTYSIQCNNASSSNLAKLYQNADNEKSEFAVCVIKSFLDPRKLKIKKIVATGGRQQGPKDLWFEYEAQSALLRAEYWCKKDECNTIYNFMKPHSPCAPSRSLCSPSLLEST